ncbi:membrane protein, putative [Candidatus Vecturithrix granuli]|uniref:Membrane protein, putative n=1 Tax=Vecturithrix granuli TaxID=1499967 RepID=A0A081BWM1_VECG1|nr:membrane protein, putative [Candidatus Vecturithrix granuli]
MKRETCFQHPRTDWLVLLLVVVILSGLLPRAEAADTVVLYFFWGDGCPHCEKEKEFLHELKQRYPQLEMRWFETWDHQELRNLADAIRKAYALEKSSVPLTILGNWTMIGFLSPEESGVQIEDQVIRCLENGCEDALEKLGPHRLAAKVKADIASGNPQEWEWFPASQAQTE